MAFCNSFQKSHICGAHTEQFLVSKLSHLSSGSLQLLQITTGPFAASLISALLAR